MTYLLQQQQKHRVWPSVKIKAVMLLVVANQTSHHIFNKYKNYDLTDI